MFYALQIFSAPGNFTQCCTRATGIWNIRSKFGQVTFAVSNRTIANVGKCSRPCWLQDYQSTTLIENTPGNNKHLLSLVYQFSNITRIVSQSNFLLTSYRQNRLWHFDGHLLATSSQNSAIMTTSQHGRTFSWMALYWHFLQHFG